MVQDYNQSLLDFFERKSVAKPWQKINNQIFSYSGQLNAVKLSEIFQTPLNQIITFFLDKGVIINQSKNLSPELISLYCQSRKIKAAKQEKSFFGSVIEEYFNQVYAKENLVSRPPIVSIMGHVNHGKTTLLDTIRNTQVQAQEKGGVTQKISIFQIVFQEKKITLLDTPGHQIFFEMRRKGINLTDLVVLVIDASEGVMPQTKEVIQHIQQNKIPTIIFLNHKNPSSTNSENKLNRLKFQLQKQGLIPADIVSGSAKEKSSTDELLGTILLLAEEKEWKTNPQLPASGVIIDSKISPQLGKITTLLVQEGNLQVKNLLLVDGKIGKIKRITSLQGKNLDQALAGDPVLVTGLDFLAKSGEKFLTITNEKLAQKISKVIGNYYSQEKDDKDFLNQSSFQLNINNDLPKTINLIVIADTQTSLEVLISLVQSKSTDSNLQFQIVASSVGNIHENLLDLAQNFNSFLLIFNLRLGKKIQQKLKEKQIKYFAGDIIYEIEEKLVELVSQKQEKNRVEKILGTAEVKKVFSFSKIGNIAGCQVKEGVINRRNPIKVIRNGQEVFNGKIKSMKTEDEKIEKAEKNRECGIFCEGFGDFQINDLIISYHWEENAS